MARHKNHGFTGTASGNPVGAWTSRHDDARVELYYEAKGTLHIEAFGDHTDDSINVYLDDADTNDVFAFMIEHALRNHPDPDAAMAAIRVLLGGVST